MEIVLLWFFFALVSAVLASGKNRSATSWFLVGLLFGPFGLIVGFMSALPKADEEIHTKVEDKQGSNVDNLVKLAELHKSGLLSSEEFEAQKRKYL